MTTSGGSFGYDGSLGLIAAFIDTSDPSTSKETDATVSNFSWALVDTEIQGTFEITNLDPGEDIVLEAWVVLQDEIAPGTTGNVQSRLISAQTGTTGSGDRINTGNQTIPLLKVKDSFSTQADSGVTNESNTITSEANVSEPNSNSKNTELTDVVEVDASNVEAIAKSANQPGVFTVDESGYIEYDFLYDGGWFQGELAVFSLAGMEAYEYGSVDYLREAAARAISNSTQGRILTSDRHEGARFDFNVSWEKNFNKGDYQGTKSFALNPGDEVGFMLAQHTTFANIYNNPQITSQWGKKVLFSTDSKQLAAVDNQGTFAYEDVRVDADGLDNDYNDFVFQVTGLTGNADSMDMLVTPDRDWRTMAMGQQLLNYAQGEVFAEGVFEVGATGEVIIDYLYDGGWYQSEVGIFSLDGMDQYNLNSDAFVTEAINRVLSHSEQGYVVTKDPLEGARYDGLLRWEKNFNEGDYLGRQIFEMNPGDRFGFVLIPDTTFEDALLASDGETRKQPLFSLTAANTDDTIQIGTIYDGIEGAVIGWEDVPRKRGSNQDYNDIVLAIEGAKAIGINSVEDLVNNGRNWLNKPIGQEIVGYFDNYSVV